MAISLNQQLTLISQRKIKKQGHMANTHLEFPPSQFSHHPHEFYRKSKCEQGEN